MNKRGLDYALSMMFIVMVVLPFLYVQMTSKTAETKKLIGESQAILLRAPYAKEDVLTYLEESAQLALPDIVTACPTGITSKFNQELDKYIDAYNAKSPVTKIPKDNYDLFIEGKNIHAVATVPVEKGLTMPGLELEKIGTIWFAPSFTVSTAANLTDCIV